jgi:4-hydroxy-3-methylbut-2-enyl diphosphate reductase IspH
VIVIVTAGVLAGGTWYYMDQQSKQATDSNNKEVESLQKQVEDLKSTSEKSKIATATQTTTNTTTTDYYKSFKSWCQTSNPGMLTEGFETYQNEICLAVLLVSGNWNLQLT